MTYVLHIILYVTTLDFVAPKQYPFLLPTIGGVVNVGHVVDLGDGDLHSRVGHVCEGVKQTCRHGDVIGCPQCAERARTAAEHVPGVEQGVEGGVLGAWKLQMKRWASQNSHTW